MGDSSIKKGPWTVEEDMLLISYITRYGHWNWSHLPKFAGLTRTGTSCRHRWMNYLRPKRGNITTEEHLLILILHSRWGNRWSKIAQFLPGRVGNEIKNYWHTIFKQVPGASESSYSNMDHNVQVQEQSRCSLSTEILPAISEDKEETHGHANPEKQSAGKKKAVEFNVSSGNNLECSWPLLSESSDEKDRESYSGSDNFSGPS